MSKTAKTDDLSFRLDPNAAMMFFNLVQIGLLGGVDVSKLFLSADLVPSLEDPTLLVPTEKWVKYVERERDELVKRAEAEEASMAAQQKKAAPEKSN